MRTIGRIGLVALLVLAMAGTAMAQQKKNGEPKNGAEPEAKMESAAPFYGPAIAAGLGAGLVIIGAGVGFGRIGASALESMARQPETAGQVQTAMLIIAALLEGATFFALIICILLSFK